MAMRKYLIALILVALLITPALASPVPSGIFADAEIFEVKGISTIDHTVDGGNAIGSVVFTMGQNTELDYTLYYQGGSASGTISYVSVPLWGNGFLSIQSTAYVSIEGNSSTSTFGDITGNPLKRFGVTGHAKDEDAGTFGLACWDTSLINAYTAQNIAYVAVDGIQKKPITRIVFTSNTPVDVTISYGEQSYIQTQSTVTGTDIINDWVEYAKKIGGTLLEVVQTAFNWIEFFFIDHLDMTVALYLAGSLAFSARACKGNPIRMLRQFFKDQVGLFRFIIGLWGKLIEIISNFRGIFRI